MTNASNEKFIEVLRSLAKDSCIQIESYNYMANFWTNYYLYLGIINTIVASIASASSLSKLFDSTVAGILTAGVAILSAITTFVNPSEKATQHKKAKEKFISLNMNARKAAIDAHSDDSDEALKKLRDQVNDLSDRMTEALQISPQVPEYVRKIAEKRAASRFIF